MSWRQFLTAGLEIIGKFAEVLKVDPAEFFGTSGRAPGKGSTKQKVEAGK
jgi:hypothetical protein